MDPETESRLAALIVEEARRLKSQADKEGVLAYLAKPRTRGRPNSQFLKATVRGIEQANRAVELNEMWKRRKMELELETERTRHKHRSKSIGSSSHACQNKGKREGDKTRRHSERCRQSASPIPSTDSRHEDTDSQSVADDLRDEGLKEDEVEEFLHSRVKRGRGAVGSRMDEPGPYLNPDSCPENIPNVRTKEDWETRIIGPKQEPDPGPLLVSKKLKKRRRDTEGSRKHSNKEKRKKKHKTSHEPSSKRKKKDNSGIFSMKS